MNFISTLLKNVITEIKNILGFDDSGIIGYTYLVILNGTVIANVGLNNSDKVNLRDFKTIIEVTRDDNNLDDEMFISLVREVARLKVQKHFSNLYKDKFGRISVCFIDIDKLEILKICSFRNKEESNQYI